MALKGMCHTGYTTNVAIDLHPKTSLGICKECAALAAGIKKREKTEGTSETAFEGEYN